MKHYMKLGPEPFEKIASGKKTIELRLYDEKRKLVKPGDEIVFTHIQTPCRSISVIVDSVITAVSFASLFKHISLADCGYEEKEITGTNHLDMNQYYPEEKQKQLGVVGIKFSKNKKLLSDINVPYEEVKAYISDSAIKGAKQIPEANEWYSWFKAIDPEVVFTSVYKTAIESNTLEAAIDFFDTVIKSYIYDQSMELRDKFCEESDYDGTEDVRKFLRRYYDSPMEPEVFFPLKTWWDSTRLSTILYFTGMSVVYSHCRYSTVFDGVDEDGDWYEVL